MMILGTLGIFFMIGLTDVLPVLRRKKRYESIVVCSMYVLSLALTLAYSADVPLPSPIKGVEWFFRDLLGLAYQ